MLLDNICDAALVDSQFRLAAIISQFCV